VVKTIETSDCARVQYIEVSYRTLSHPAVTLWEQRESLKYLKANGACLFGKPV
jgi:hypothetical protein